MHCTKNFATIGTQNFHYIACEDFWFCGTQDWGIDMKSMHWMQFFQPKLCNNWYRKLQLHRLCRMLFFVSGSVGEPQIKNLSVLFKSCFLYLLDSSLKTLQLTLARSGWMGDATNSFEHGFQTKIKRNWNWTQHANSDTESPTIPNY